MQTIGISAFPNIIVIESCDYIIAEVIIVTLKVIYREQSPLRICYAQVKVHHHFWAIDCWAEIGVRGPLRC